MFLQSSELQKLLDDEKHERNKAEEQIAILKVCVNCMLPSMTMYESAI